MYVFDDSSFHHFEFCIHDMYSKLERENITEHLFLVFTKYTRVTHERQYF